MLSTNKTSISGVMKVARKRRVTCEIGKVLLIDLLNFLKKIFNILKVEGGRDEEV